MTMIFLSSLLVTLLTSSATSISVLSFPPGTQGSENSSVRIYQTAGDSNITVTDLSFCFWFKVDNLKSAKILNFDTNEKSGLRFTVQEHYGFLNLKNVDLLFDYNFAHVPDKWQHICVTYNSSEEKIDIYANSLVTFSRVNLTALSGHSFHPDLMSLITIGEAKARFSQRFSGEFSKLYIWSRALTGLEVDRSYQCGEIEPDESLIFNWDLASLETGDTVQSYHLQTDCPGTLNHDTSILVGFGYKLLFDQALAACHGLGGRMSVPASDDDIRRMVDSFTDLRGNCNSKFWVPVRQNQARDWVSAVSGLAVTYQPWAAGQPNGGRHQACAEAKIDRIRGMEVETYQGYNDLNCAKSTRCFHCNIKSLERFTLRGLGGLCQKLKVDTHFVNVIETIAGSRKRPGWRGYTDWEIRYSEEDQEWQIRSVASGEVVGTYNGTARSVLWPTGLRTWNIAPLACQSLPPSNTADLLLSSCSEEELTCGDGSCQPLSSKCDGVPDCPDQLDERQCQVVEFPQDRFYQKSLPPVYRDEDQKILPTNVKLSVDLITVSNVKELKMQFRVKFGLSLQWYEPRLRWRDLRNNSNLNVIPVQSVAEEPLSPPSTAASESKTRLVSSFSVDTRSTITQSPQGLAGVMEPPVWVPSVVFVNTPDTDVSLVDSKASLTVSKQGKHSLASLDRVEQVLYYEGTENPIKYNRKYAKDFSCNIKLNHYPFDIQVCKMKLELPSQLEGLVRLEPDLLSFSGPREMLQFTVEDWKMTETEEGLEIEITLQRIFYHHLYNTYVPTLCLMIICQATLYFNKEHFKTNVPVTITTMLVMYTLYMAVSNKLPPTSYIKLIDIWLIFGLILPFTVFFLHVLIEHFPIHHQDSAKALRLQQTRDLFIIVGKFVLPCLILAFATIYFVTAGLIYNKII